MRCGLFGKLGAKRDFIALATPRRFLEAWEPWVQACMSASRHQLGAGWQQAFLTAPVWRFWLGADICGTTVVGAIMPSLDGVGRYYPLTLLAIADPSYSMPPPDLNAQDEWFAAAEEFLLATLDQAKSFEDISAALDAMTAPLAEASVGNSPEVVALDDTGRNGDSRQSISGFACCCCVKAITGSLRPRASGGRKVAEASRRWRCARGECRIHFAIPLC